jgi:hypothetical protein
MQTCSAWRSALLTSKQALTVLGRLVGSGEDMAVAVDRLQLFDTDLRGAFLAGANLQFALLGGAHLQGASLRDADLRGAYLVYTQFSDVSLHCTDLRGTNLRCASSRVLGIYSMLISAARSPTPRLGGRQDSTLPRPAFSSETISTES